MFLIRWIGITALLLGLAIGVEELRLARVQKQIAEAREKVATLKTAVADQNAGVDRLAAAGSRVNLNANLSVLRALRDGAEKRAAIERAGHGPEEMNRWLTETFPR